MGIFDERFPVERSSIVAYVEQRMSRNGLMKQPEEEKISPVKRASSRPTILSTIEQFRKENVEDVRRSAVIDEKMAEIRMLLDRLDLKDVQSAESPPPVAGYDEHRIEVAEKESILCLKHRVRQIHESPPVTPASSVKPTLRSSSSGKKSRVTFALREETIPPKASTASSSKVVRVHSSVPNYPKPTPNVKKILEKAKLKHQPSKESIKIPVVDLKFP